MKKGIKRCPGCKSANIYKRCRQSFFPVGGKGRHTKKSADECEAMSKRYKCHRCKKVFDNPLILGLILG